jgi:ankyrin repeat protein
MNRIDQELIVAADANNLLEIQRLLSVGADVNVRDTANGVTPLIVASCAGHVQVVKELVEHGAEIEAKTIDGYTALHFACAQGHPAVVKELRDHGANIEAKENHGSTPLHWACSKGDLAIVKVLVIGGANILTANNDGHLPIDHAVSRGNSAVAKYLLQHSYATTSRFPLYKLLEDVAWINGPNSPTGDVPPLFLALHLNVLGTDDVVEIVEFLVDRDPTSLVSSHDQDGSLPLHVACRRGASFPIVQSLVNRYKASVKSVTPQRDLPLFLACEMPETSLDTIFLLMKLYPDLVYR